MTSAAPSDQASIWCRAGKEQPAARRGRPGPAPRSSPATPSSRFQPMAGSQWNSSSLLEQPHAAPGAGETASPARNSRHAEAEMPPNAPDIAGVGQARRSGEADQREQRLGQGLDRYVGDDRGAGHRAGGCFGESSAAAMPMISPPTCATGSRLVDGFPHPTQHEQRRPASRRCGHVPCWKTGVPQASAYRKRSCPTCTRMMPD